MSRCSCLSFYRLTCVSNTFASSLKIAICSRTNDRWQPKLLCPDGLIPHHPETSVSSKYVLLGSCCFINEKQVEEELCLFDLLYIVTDLKKCTIWWLIYSTWNHSCFRLQDRRTEVVQMQTGEISVWATLSFKNMSIIPNQAPNYLVFACNFVRKRSCVPMQLCIPSLIVSVPHHPSICYSDSLHCLYTMSKVEE